MKPKKSLGQNFLINPHIIDKVIAAAQIKKDDIILEVGPGTGNLTRGLAGKAGRIIAIEKDARLIELLKENFRSQTNVEIIAGDVLETGVPDSKLELRDSSYKIVANIPYYITSNFLRTVFEKWPRPELIVLTIQKEVAQRIMAKPPRMNLLALSVQYYSRPEIVGYISKNNFRPVPKIDSAIIKLIPQSVIRDPSVFKIIHIGFSEKRKQLAGIFSKKLNLSKEEINIAFKKSGLNPKTRAENLSFEQWQKLSEALFS